MFAEPLLLLLFGFGRGPNLLLHPAEGLHKPYGPDDGRAAPQRTGVDVGRAGTHSLGDVFEQRHSLLRPRHGCKP
jgi:hypothetical protein